jgi:TRAP transporter TAXI family solute receptor
MRQPQKSPKSRPLGFFLSLDPLTSLILLILGGLSISLAVTITWNLVNRNKVHHLTLVAGNQDGESYILSKAIEQVVEANEPNIDIDVRETGGTAENIKLLEEGKAQLATAQADIPAGPSARNVALLYKDTFQLVVKEKSRINRFVDLRGKRIGLPQTGGQFRSFLDVAAHYGLTKEDFQFIGNSDREVNEAFRQGRVDAVFRVRASGNQSIFDLVQQDQGRLLPIEQAAAMRIKYPAFEPAILPQGAYRGYLPVPRSNLPTVAVQRTLLASKKVNNEVIQKIAAVLDEHRQELTDAIPDEFAEIRPLVASINRPSTTGGAGIPLHPGAIAFYERDKPSFIQEYADYVGLILTVILLVGSWLWQLKSWIEQRKKDAADVYIESAIQLMQDDGNNPEQKLQELDKIFSQAAADLVGEKISQESFRTFNEAYKTTREGIEHQIKLVQKENEKQAKIVEQQQRELSSRYIKSVVALLQDGHRGKDLIQQDLDRLLEKAAHNLIQDHISQESFRTFIEAYKTTRDSLDRKNI